MVAVIDPDSWSAICVCGHGRVHHNVLTLACESRRACQCKKFEARTGITDEPDEREPLTDEELEAILSREGLQAVALDELRAANATDLLRLISEVRRLRAEKAALLNCAHAIHTPVTSVDWCRKCGAVAVEGQWQKTVS